MASGNRASKHVAGRDDKEREELGRVKEHLQEVIVKNQHLEEMLLYTSQELEKEKENSRKIVQTLTERLMESREMINKLEVENMRYKKDCLLAVELLQCNRSVDQAYVTRTVRKLSDQMDPPSQQTLTFGNSFALEENDHENIEKPTKGETKNIQETRPRTTSKRKSKSETNDANEDRTALLGGQESNEIQVKVLGQEDITLKDNEPERQYKQANDETGLVGLPLRKDSSHKERPDNSQDIGGVNEKSCAQDQECLSKECQQEDKSLFEDKQLETSEKQADLKSEKGNSVGHCLNENEEEWLEEDKPLIVDEIKSSTQQSLSAPRPKENIKSSGENPHTVNPVQKNTGHEKHGDIRQESTTTVENKNILPKETQKDGDDEADKLLSSDAEKSEENHAQQISPKLTRPASEREAKSNEGNARAFVDDDGKSSMDDSPTEVENETSNERVETPVALQGGDDETSTAEENTPLV